MMLIVITFILTTVAYGVLIWFASRRLVAHLRDNPEAVAALSEHLIIPILGRKPPEDPGVGQ